MYILYQCLFLYPEDVTADFPPHLICLKSGILSIAIHDPFIYLKKSYDLSESKNPIGSAVSEILSLF